MHHFDAVLKFLLRNSIARIAGRPVVKWLATELPAVEKLSIDMLGETADGELTHIEIQSGHDKKMPSRMLRYLGLIVAIHDRIPKQVLLYAGRERLRMESEFTWADGVIRYQVIDMLGVDGEPLLASAEPSDNVLAILARLGNRRAAVRRILENISRLPRQEAAEYYQALLIIAGLRSVEELVEAEAKHMALMIDITENKVLGPVYLQGREEGLLQGQLDLLRRLIERKFGMLPEWVEQKLSQSSAQEIEAVGVRMLDATTLEDLFR